MAGHRSGPRCPARAGPPPGRLRSRAGAGDHAGCPQPDGRPAQQRARPRAVDRSARGQLARRGRPPPAALEPARDAGTAHTRPPTRCPRAMRCPSGRCPRGTASGSSSTTTAGSAGSCHTPAGIAGSGPTCAGTPARAGGPRARQPHLHAGPAGGGGAARGDRRAVTRAARGVGRRRVARAPHPRRRRRGRLPARVVGRRARRPLVRAQRRPRPAPGRAQRRARGGPGAHRSVPSGGDTVAVDLAAHARWWLEGVGGTAYAEVLLSPEPGPAHLVADRLHRAGAAPPSRCRTRRGTDRCRRGAVGRGSGWMGA